MSKEKIEQLKEEIQNLTEQLEEKKNELQEINFPDEEEKKLFNYLT